MGIFRDFFVKEKPVFTGITRGIGGFGFGAGAGASSGGSNEDYWFARLFDSNGNNLEGHGIGVDDSGNVYTGMSAVNIGQGSYEIALAKYDSSGSLQWQRSLGGTDSEALRHLHVDGDGNAYICGYTFSAGQGSIDIYIAKYNSSGSLQWDRVIGGSTGDNGNGITTDSSGNVYVTGYYRPPGTSYDQLFLAKFNSAGTVQWQRLLPGNSEDTVGKSVATDSSGNVYVAGGIGNFGYYICKWDSSGALQWQTRQGTTSYSTTALTIAVDSSSNLYVSGRSYNGSTAFEAVTLKISSAGSVVWQRTLSGNNSVTGNGIAVDSAGDVYLCCDTNPGGSLQGQYGIVKYNSSGTVQWQRMFGRDSQTDTPFQIVAKNDSVYVNGRITPSAYQTLVLKVPDDGSLTGTYGDYTYSSLSLTATSTGPLTGSTPSNTNTSSSVTIGTASLTSAVSSLSSSTTVIE